MTQSQANRRELDDEHDRGEATAHVKGIRRRRGHLAGFQFRVMTWGYGDDDLDVDPVGKRGIHEPQRV